MKQTILPLFDLHHDQAEHSVIEHTIHQGVKVGGTNLWVLIFAILMASIGLNVNSTAVIIGAMLISPLMGPIIAIGFGVATNDADLIRTALRNLGLFVAISLITSVLYFKLSPLSLAHSELLARTSPTLWDVLIAFFGGAAGIIALTRKHASPVLPGVAIATALMPPLCTAGYGLASGNLAFFGGAFYLFAINSVFIALATALFVRLMKLPQHAHASSELQRRTRIWVSVLLVAMLAPSTWLGYRLVKDEFFLKAANAAFDLVDVKEEYFELSRQIDVKTRKLVLTIGGGQPPADLSDRIKADMQKSGFPDTNVSVRYLGTANIARELNRDIEEVYTKALTQLDNTSKTMQALVKENQRLKENLPARDTLVQEILVQYPVIQSVAITDGRLTGRDAGGSGDVTLVTLILNGKMAKADSQRLEAWLQTRLKNKKVLLLTGNAPAPATIRE
ncbi:MAG: DUF389 domain-containing protein [Agitococcus sp.]|nr:DUF389 domain-containing protein [Agitococcus sp.]